MNPWSPKTSGLPPTRLIGELGTEAYLRQLLAVLKGDYPRQPDDMPGG